MTSKPLFQVKKHQANFSSPQSFEPPLLVLRSRLPLPSQTAPWNENMPHDINNQQSFKALPLKSNGQSKTRMRTTEFHPIQQSLGMIALMEYTGGAFRNTT